MELYFIRHAQSENNALYARTGGWEGRSPDPNITKDGEKQASLLADFLSKTPPAPLPFSRRDSRNGNGFALTHLYCSPMRRAIITATPVAEKLRLPLPIWEDLHERGGIFQHDEAGQRMGLAGADRHDFERNFPHLILPDGWAEGGWWQRPAEEREQMPVRAARVLGQLRERHGGTEDRVALISHAGFYQDLLRCLLSPSTGNLTSPEAEPVWFVLNNTAVTRMDFQERGIALVYQNRTDFLPESLVTS